MPSTGPDVHRPGGAQAADGGARAQSDFKMSELLMQLTSLSLCAGPVQARRVLTPLCYAGPVRPKRKGAVGGLPSARPIVHRPGAQA